MVGVMVGGAQVRPAWGLRAIPPELINSKRCMQALRGLFTLLDSNLRVLEGLTMCCRSCVQRRTQSASSWWTASSARTTWACSVRWPACQAAWPSSSPDATSCFCACWQLPPWAGAGARPMASCRLRRRRASAAGTPARMYPRTCTCAQQQASFVCPGPSASSHVLRSTSG